MPPDSRRRNLDGWEAIQNFLDGSDVEDWTLVEEALFSIIEGTWQQKYTWNADVTTDAAVFMLIGNGLLMRWRQLEQYPDWFRVSYIGTLDGD